MSKYSKNLSGQKLKVFVSPATEYTDDTTYASFIDNAADGEIGVFLSSGAVQTTALAPGDEFFIAQKRNSIINKTALIKYDDIFSLRYAAAVAPVKQVSYLGYIGSGSLDFGFTFTAASSTNTLTFQASVRETTPGNQPFPVQEGYATVNSTTADEYDVLATIVSQMNGDDDHERTAPDRFVKVEITANGALTELTQNLTVTNGSVTTTAAASITIATGTLVSIQDSIYKVASGGTGTTFTLDRPYQGTSETINVGATTDKAATMAYTSGTTKLGLRFTALENDSHFIVAPFTGLVNDTVTNSTAWKMGVGAGAQVAELEKEGIIFDGLGSTVNAAFKDDYGQPTLYTNTALNYNLFFVEAAPKILPSAALPIYEQKQIQRIVIAAPSTGTSPTTELQAVLGV